MDRDLSLQPTFILADLKWGKKLKKEQRISELILRSPTFPGYLGTTSIEPDTLGNRRYVFRFADRESLERWFNSPEPRDCLAQLEPLTSGIPSYEAAILNCEVGKPLLHCAQRLGGEDVTSKGFIFNPLPPFTEFHHVFVNVSEFKSVGVR